MSSDDESDSEDAILLVKKSLEKEKKELEERIKDIEREIKSSKKKLEKKRNKIKDNFIDCHSISPNQNEELPLSSLLHTKENVIHLCANTFMEKMPLEDFDEDENCTPVVNDKRFNYKQKKKAEKEARKSAKETKGDEYLRTTSQCDISGPLYEMKVSALLYLRGVRKELDFLLSTSVEAAGLYDDVTFAFRVDSVPKQMLVQLKHKENRHINKEMLLAKETANHGFSLLACYQSFCKLREKFEENHVLNNYSEFKDIDFVLFTNAPAISSDGVFTDADVCACDNNILDMGGKVFSFAQNQQFLNEFKSKYPSIIDDHLVEEFFNQFYVYTNQKSEQDLDDEIKNEMMLLYNISDLGANTSSAVLLTQIQAWWRDRTRTRRPLKSGEFVFKSGTEIFGELNVEPAKLKFKTKVTRDIMAILCVDVKIINCVTDIDMCAPACELLQQSLRETSARCLTVSLEDVESSCEEVLNAWPSRWCPNLLIFESGMQFPVKSLRKMFDMIEKSLNHYKEAKLFLVSKQGKLAETLLHTDFRKSSFKEVNVTCQMNHLTKECKKQVLMTMINFQGTDVTLQSVLKQNGDSAVDACLLSRLVYSDKTVSIGCMKNERINSYIDRELTRNSFLKKSVLMCHSKDIFAVDTGTQELSNFLNTNEHDYTLFGPKQSVTYEVSFHHKNDISFWYSNGSLIDTTLMASNIFFRSLERQVKEHSGLDKPNKVQPQTCSDSSLNENLSVKVFYNIDSIEKLASLCKNNRYKNVHWLKLQKGKLKWIKTRGTLTNIKRHVSEEKESLCAVNTVWDVPDRIVILTGDSGMGKTSLLRQVALNSKDKHPETCIIQISLIECLSDIEKLESEITQEKACEFLIQNGMLLGETNQSSDVAFLKYILTESSTAAVLVDGFDEVCPENESEVLNLIKSFCKLRISKLWIASRRHMTSRLEIITGSIHFELEPLKISESERLIQLLVGNDKPFLTYDAFNLPNDNNVVYLGNPLHCKIISEIITNNMENELLTNRNGIDPLVLMETIIDIKFEIYYGKYVNFSSENKQTCDIKELKRKNFLKNHQLSALLQEGLSTFPVKYKDGIKKQLKNYMQVVKEGAEKTGIVSTVQGGVPQFEHKIYADYFLALWVAENCRGVRVGIIRNILEHIIFDPQFSSAVFFFNMMKAKKSKLHTDILKNYWISSFPEALRLVKELQINQVDEAGRTVLHLVLSFWSCSRNNVNVMLTKEGKQTEMVAHLLELGANLTVKDKLLKWSPFKYSNIKTVPWSIVALMIDWNGVEERDKQELIERVQNDKFDALNGLVCGVHFESEKLISFLLENGIHVDESIDDMGDTVLIIAAGHGKFEILKYLHSECNADPQIKNNNGDTPLHWACLKGHMTIVSYLIRKCKMATDIINSTGYTPLLAAARGGHLEIVRYLRESCRSSCEERNNFGQSALFLAARYPNDDRRLVVYLVNKCGLETTECDQFGLLPVTAACLKGNINIVKFFVENCALDPQMELKNGSTLLHFIITLPQFDQVKDLLSRYEHSLDVTDREGFTLLMTTICSPRRDLHEYLRSKCSNVKAVNKSGDSVLHVYIVHSLIVELDRVQWLVETCEIDPNTVNCHGFTALHFAINRSQNFPMSFTIQPGVLEYLQEKTK